MTDINIALFHLHFFDPNIFNIEGKLKGNIIAEKVIVNGMFKSNGEITADEFVSLIGSGIQAIALPLYILDVTGSGTLMGIFSILTLAPALLAAPFSGILGDRKNRKNIMVVTDFGI